MHAIRQCTVHTYVCELGNTCIGLFFDNFHCANPVSMKNKFLIIKRMTRH